jgi:hypothetical protein
MFGQEGPLSERCLVVERARTVVFRAGKGGLAGAARGAQSARASRAPGCARRPPSRPVWAVS